MSGRDRINSTLAAAILVLLVTIVSLIGCSDDDNPGGPVGGNGDYGWHVQALEFDGKPFTGTLQDIEFVDADHGWAVGYDGVVLRTTDGGRNWERREYGGSSWFFDADFTSSSDGLCVGLTGLQPYDGLMLRTIDGGSNWSALPLFDSTILHGIAFVDTSFGCAVGGLWGETDVGIIHRTVDGGQTWAPSWEAKGKLYAIQFLDGNGWTVGHGGWILTTSDSGVSWRAEHIDTSRVDTAQLVTSPFYGVAFADNRTGWIVGKGGAIFHTTDNGGSWERQACPTTADLRDIQFIDSRVGWATGADGIILYTENGGATWAIQRTGTGLDLQGMAIIDAYHAWAVGEDGMLLGTSTGGK